MKSIFRLGLALCTVVGMVYGCGSDETSPAPATAASSRIGPAGGVVSVNGVTLTIPPGALDAETDIGIESGAPAPSGYTALSPVFRFTPDGLVFKKPANVAIDFQGGSGSPTVFWSAASGPVEKLATTVEGSRAKADVVHFSTGFVGTDGTAADGGTPSGDGGTPAAALGDIGRMCLMNNACGYQTIFQLPADKCTDQALKLISGHAEVHTPEHRKHFEKMIACAKTAKTCDDYVKCSDFDVPCNGTVQPTCNGNVAVRCSTPGGNNMPRTFDCSLLGGTCVNGDCVYPAGVGSCADTTSASCSGNTRQWCRSAAGGGFTALLDPCPAGTECMASGSQAVCQPPVKTCAAPAASCDGDTAVYCIDDKGTLAEVRYDCAAANRKCALNAKGAPECMPKATECTASTSGTSAACNGTSVKVCIEGAFSSVDCTTLGKTSCGGSPATCQ